MMRGMLCGPALVTIIACNGLPASAQMYGAALEPDTVTVGGHFRVAVRVEVPPGMRILFPDTLDVPDQVEAAATRVMQSDTAASGVETLTAVYTLAAWKPGTIELPPAQIQLLTEAGPETIAAPVPAVTVRSVLPADTAGIEPMPLKDVLGPDRALLPLLLALLLGLALLGLGIWAWRRRKPASDAFDAAPGIPPRERALGQLDRLLASGLLERGDLRSFYFSMTAIVRAYVGSLSRDWGTELTTAELHSHMLSRFGMHDAPAARAAADLASQAARLDALLQYADLVKFARHGGAAANARRDCDSLRHWIEDFDWPPRQQERAA